MLICSSLLIKSVKLSRRVCFLCAISQYAVSDSWLNQLLNVLLLEKSLEPGPHISASYAVQFPHNNSENAF